MVFAENERNQKAMNEETLIEHVKAAVAKVNEATGRNDADIEITANSSRVAFHVFSCELSGYGQTLPDAIQDLIEQFPAPGTDEITHQKNNTEQATVVKGAPGARGSRAGVF